MKSLSIIIPIYNTPSLYLNACLSSIESLAHSFQIEILLLDDGSTSEDTINILKKYSSHERFRYYALKNGGVSHAKNQGIFLSKNEYIMFIDSDDLLVPDGINYFFNDDTSNSDFYNFNFEVIDERGKVKKRYFLNKNPYAGNGVCRSKIFKASIIKENNLLFSTELKYAEDTLFLKKYLELCSSKLTVNRFVYKYRINLANTSHRYNENVFEDFNKTLINLRNEEYAPLAMVMYLGRYIFPIYIYNKECAFSNEYKKQIINRYLESDSYEYKFLMSRLPALKTNLYRKIYIFLLNHKKYKTMVWYDKLIVKLFRKYC